MTPDKKEQFKKKFDSGKMKMDDSWNRYHNPQHPNYQKLRKRYGWLRDNVKGGRVLDIGCGPGVGLMLFAQKADITSVVGWIYVKKP